MSNLSTTFLSRQELFSYYCHIFEIGLLIRMVFFILFFIYMKSESAYVDNKITTISSATMNEEREREKYFKCDHTTKQKKQCIRHYFSRTFLVLQLSTNFSLEASFFYSSKGNRIGWSTWVRREKNQEKTFQHSI